MLYKYISAGILMQSVVDKPVCLALLNVQRRQVCHWMIITGGTTGAPDESVTLTYSSSF